MSLDSAHSPWPRPEQMRTTAGKNVSSDEGAPLPTSATLESEGTDILKPGDGLLESSPPMGKMVKPTRSGKITP